jgi:catechol-2,3-dioxygenase
MSVSSVQPSAEATAQGGGRRPVRPTQIAHVILRTRDRIKELTEFYTVLLDASPVLMGPNNAFLTFDDEHHRLGIFQFPFLPDRQHNAPGLDHFAFTLPSLRALFECYERAKAAGYLPFAPVNHCVTTSLYYYDPDGNRVEIQADNFDSAQEAITFMNSIAPDSIGVLYDAEEVSARLAAGEPEEPIKEEIRNSFGPTEQAVLDLFMAPWIDPGDSAGDGVTR